MRWRGPVSRRPTGEPHERTSPFHRHPSFHRHRRHRDERHRRDPVRDGLSGAGKRQRRERQCAPPPRKGDQGHLRPVGRQYRGCLDSGDFDRHQARQSRARGGAREVHPGRSPGRDAWRADAASLVGRCRRNARQDDDHLARGDASRRRRHRPHGGQWRHHHRMGKQCPPRARPVDGRRGRRKRRILRQAEPDRRRRHKHRPRASRPSRKLRGAGAGVPQFRRIDPLLRLRHPVHRPSGGAAADGRNQGPARDHLRPGRECRCPRGQSAP